MKEKYFWIRVFEYKFERDEIDKGLILDEFYIKDINSREEVKEVVKDRYCGKSKNELKFAKPRKGKDGLYAIVMDSDKYWYDRFYKTIDTYCFHCHKHIKGKEASFFLRYIGDECEGKYFCSYDCYREFKV